MLSDTFNKTMTLLASPQYATGRTGTQVYVSQYGEPVLETVAGARAQGCAMSVNSRIVWLCCSKPVLLIALFQALADAGLSENEPVASIMPEFANAGKGAVALSHLLTHTVPYRSLGMTWTNDEVVAQNERAVMAHSWDTAIKVICEMPLMAKPGELITYTKAANWMVLAEVLQRLTGRPHEESVAQRVLAPLGMDHTGIYATEQSLAELEYAPLQHVDDLDDEGEPRIEEIETRPLVFARWPGLGCRGPARDMARPVECAAGWSHPEILDGAWRTKLLTPCRTDLSDPTLYGAEMLWSLGLCVDPVRFGLPLSARVAGQTGEQSSLVCADLDSGITVSFLCSGLVPDAADLRRKRALIRAIYADLGLPLASAR